MRYIDILILSAFVLTLIVIIGLLITYRSEGLKCIYNPVEYGIKTMEKQFDLNNVYCTCFTNSNTWKNIIVTRNSTKPFIP